MTPWESLSEGAKAYGLTLSEHQIDQFRHLYALLLEGNQKMNLTRITEERDVVVKHFLDSLSLLKVYDEPTVRLVDVGAGAGFPALPLLIARPAWSAVLVESVQKKARFIEETAQILGLSATVLPKRAEDVGRDPAYRDRFDLAVARAVSELSVLSELCLPLVRHGGFFAAYKGGDLETELSEARNAIRKLGGVLQEVVTLELPEGAGARTLVLIEKQGGTPAAYPRPAGVPQRKKLR